MTVRRPDELRGMTYRLRPRTAGETSNEQWRDVAGLLMRDRTDVDRVYIEINDIPED